MFTLKNVFNSVAKHLQLTPTRFFRAKNNIQSTTSHRIPPPCACPGGNPKPCFNIREVKIERFTKAWTPNIWSFLLNQVLTREPTIIGFYFSPSDCYLNFLACLYARSGDRWLAFEKEPRTGEQILIGVMVGNKKLPWEADKLEKWANDCCENMIRAHLLLRARAYRRPDLFKKYKVPFVYDIEVIGTSADVARQGVADLLLRTGVQYCKEMKYPMTQVIATNSYMNSACLRSNMTHEWKMNFVDFKDIYGRNLLYPRGPHTAVNVYARKLNSLRT